MNIGLVVSGGMAKGAYEVGALQAISEYFRPEDFSVVSAASIGVLNAYAFCSGKLDNLPDMWRGLIPPDGKVFIRAAMKSDYLKYRIGELSADPVVCGRFFFPIFNMLSRNNCYIDITRREEAFRDAYLRAAVAFFPICKPVEICGNTYYDGALIDNIPICTMVKRKLDYIICLYFDKNDYKFESHKFDKKIIKISFYDEKEIIKKSIWFERDNIEQMIAKGYKKTKSVLDFVFMKGTDNVGEILGRIEELNMINQSGNVRLTGDIAIRNLNRLAQLLTVRRFVDE